MAIELILTHPGGAHKDDFLACCILAHLHGVTIHRREPTEDDLSTPDTCVVDTGGIHDATLKNFGTKTDTNTGSIGLNESESMACQVLVRGWCRYTV